MISNYMKKKSNRFALTKLVLQSLYAATTLIASRILEAKAVMKLGEEKSFVKLAITNALKGTKTALNPIPPMYVRVSPSRGSVVDVQAASFISRMSSNAKKRFPDLTEKEKKQLVRDLALRKAELKRKHVSSKIGPSADEHAVSVER